MATAQQADPGLPGAGRVALLRDVLAHLRDPAGGLYLHGRPGAGMSTLLAGIAARARRRGHRLITVNASNAERTVAFAGLHQILHACRRLPAARPALDLLTAVVGGGTAGPEVVAGTASLCAAIAADGPALIVVDNAHRLDPPTAEALAGVSVPGLAMVLGGHAAGARAWPALTTLALPGLPAPAARHLLRAHAPGLNRWLADRILDEAAGRPLALVELPIAWRDRYTPGADLLEQHSPLTTRLAQSLLEEIAALPAAARQVLVKVAAGEPCPPAQLRAAGALDAFLATDVDGVRLADPLLAAALLHGTLEATNRPARSPGGPVRAALAAVRAGQSGERAGRTIIEGAGVAAELGRHDVVAALLAALPERINPIDAARRDIVRRWADDETGVRSSTAATICAVADSCRGAGNPESALDLLAGLAETLHWSDVDEPARVRLLSALDDLGDHRDDPRWRLVCAAVDPRRAGDLGRAAGDDARRVAGLAMRRTGRLEPAAELLDGVVGSLARERRFGILVPAAAALADVELFLGRWPDADRHLRCAARAAERIEHPTWRAYLQATTALLDALRGEPGDTADRAERALGDRAAWPVRMRIAAARGMALMAGERYAEARAEFEPVLAGPAVRAYTIDLIFIATLYAEAGGRDVVLATVPAALHANPSPDGAAHLRYLRMLLEPPADLDRACTGLIQQTERLPWLRARVQLHHGSWLRRERRVSEAREQLHNARGAFATLSARYWSERTDQELRAAGAGPRPLGGLLSPQELAVVKLAATGLSNREIGARLALSPRTVESHLARAFPKLSIGSRHQLPARLHELT